MQRGTTLIWNVYTNPTGGAGYDYTFINYRWNRALDYPAASKGYPGWQYGIYDYVNSPGQRFALFSKSNDPFHYEIACDLGGLGNFMDAWATHSGNGNPVGGEQWTGHDRQSWMLDFV